MYHEHPILTNIHNKKRQIRAKCRELKIKSNHRQNNVNTVSKHCYVATSFANISAKYCRNRLRVKRVIAKTRRGEIFQNTAWLHGCGVCSKIWRCTWKAVATRWQITRATRSSSASVSSHPASSYCSWSSPFCCATCRLPLSWRRGRATQRPTLSPTYCPSACLTTTWPTTGLSIYMRT